MKKQLQLYFLSITEFISLLISFRVCCYLIENNLKMSGMKKKSTTQRGAKEAPAEEMAIALPKSTPLGTLDSDEDSQEYKQAAPIHTESDQLDAPSTSWQRPASPVKTLVPVSPARLNENHQFTPNQRRRKARGCSENSQAPLQIISFSSCSGT
jgi:hypothetical protein